MESKTTTVEDYAGMIDSINETIDQCEPGIVFVMRKFISDRDVASMTCAVDELASI